MAVDLILGKIKNPYKDIHAGTSAGPAARQVLFFGVAPRLLAGKVSWPTYFRLIANRHFTLLRPFGGWRDRGN